jgi:hypothetical protein
VVAQSLDKFCSALMNDGLQEGLGWVSDIFWYTTTWTNGFDNAGFAQIASQVTPRMIAQHHHDTTKVMEAW